MEEMSIYDITESNRINALLNKRWLRHLLYWGVTVMFFTFFWGSDKNDYQTVLLNELMLLPPKLLAVYTVLMLLVPRLLFKKKLLLFTLATFLVMMLCGTLLLILQDFVHSQVLSIFIAKPTAINRFEALSAMVDINTVLIIPLVIKIVEHGYRNMQRSELLEREKLETELQFLKTQIHPHFFFNTLNNLYSLVLKKSDRAPEVVLMLSALMRYVLYESNVARVSVDKELNHISNYINLEKLRLPADSEIRFTVHGNVAAMTIEPMLLIPIIENCFKHASAPVGDSIWILIDIKVEEGLLIMNTENSIDTASQGADKGPHGVGMKNVERRLELLYPNRYELKAITDGFSYLCKLKIELS
jgi:sensor histidine kinase YesM